MANRTADRLVEALMLDIWPTGMACYVDFGLDDGNYAAFQRAIKHNGVTADQLHAAVNSSKKLSALIGVPISVSDFDIDGWDDESGFEPAESGTQE